MDTQKENILIAEFTGLKIITDDISFFDTTFKSLKKYHESWDSLMPVVEQIEECDVVASFQIEQPTIWIWASSESSTFEDIEVDIFTKSKIEAVHEAVVKFILWYNQNQD